MQLQANPSPLLRVNRKAYNATLCCKMDISLELRVVRMGNNLYLSERQDFIARRHIRDHTFRGKRRSLHAWQAPSERCSSVRNALAVSLLNVLGILLHTSGVSARVGGGCVSLAAAEDLARSRMTSFPVRVVGQSRGCSFRSPWMMVSNSTRPRRQGRQAWYRCP